jgi:hypothetical protein
MAPNPLASTQKQPASSAPDPMLVHARLWRHAHSMDDDALAHKTDQVSYTLPIIGKLAGDPNVKPKDVIKAAASAAADGKATAQEAVQMISQMPSDPEKLQPWLKQLYAVQMTSLVHMKAAAMMRSGQGAPGAGMAAALGPQGAAAPAAPASPAPGSAPA